MQCIYKNLLPSQNVKNLCSVNNNPFNNHNNPGKSKDYMFIVNMLIKSLANENGQWI